MKITVFGTGYVGLVTGACLAEAGHEVLCVDVDTHKIARLHQGIIPIYEPGLESLVRRNQTNGQLRFTTDAGQGVAHGLFQFIAVGTPPDEDGSADLQYVLAVARSIATHMTEYRVVVDKSTVPVGTADSVKATMIQGLKARGLNLSFDVVSNPEFLKEGAAIGDFMKPDRIIIGCDNERVEPLMRELYAPFNRNHDRLIMMDVRSAELTKYASNAMLATKISFMNELARIAETVGADIEQVRQGMGADSRIGYHFIYPGCGYGGSCFPKDVKALVRTAIELGIQPALLEAVESVNDRQKRRLIEKIHQFYPDGLNGKVFALWGLAFKPNTDDMREAPSRVVMEALWEAGATVQAFDPEAMEECRRIYPQVSGLRLMDTKEAALHGANALIICTEWNLFRAPDFILLHQQLADRVIFDGRNLYEPQRVIEHGLRYCAIGRGQTIHAAT